MEFPVFLVADQCPLKGTVRLKHLQDPEHVIVCNRQDGIASVIQGDQFYRVVSCITFSVFPDGDTGEVPSNEYILDHEEHVAVLQPVVISEKEPARNHHKSQTHQHRRNAELLLVFQSLFSGLYPAG